MSTINRVYLTGRLIKKPELAMTKTNKKAVLNMTMGVDLGKEDLLFIDVKLWASSPEWETSALSCEAGDIVYVIGKLGKDYRTKIKLL